MFRATIFPLSLAVVFMLLTAHLQQTSGSDPVPDTSEKCLACEAQMSQLQNTWTNETTVAEILTEMQQNCKAYPFLKQKMCDKVAEVLVQIPPALFDGMDSLAWPVPEAVCASILQCKVNCCGEDSPPEQVHLSFSAQDRSQMAVTWVTLNATASVVQYGLSPDALDREVVGTIDTYTAAGWVGTVHRAMMTGLAEKTRGTTDTKEGKEGGQGVTWYYRVGDPNAPSPCTAWSEVLSFTTLPAVSSEDTAVTYAVLADMGYGSTSDGTVADLIQLVENGTIQAVIHSGDVSYADGYEPHWDVFFNKIQPIAARVPYMVTPGNHEFWYNFTSYKTRFTMPSSELNPGSGSGDNMYYAWEVDHAHFVAADSESPIDTAYFSDTQVDWMTQDLTQVDSARTPWKIVHFHRPIYCTNDGDCIDSGSKGGGTYIQGRVEDLFYSQKVDLVITGHVHGYQRTFPVYKEEAQQTDYASPSAPTYLLQGASGNREGNKGSYPDVSELPEWVADSHSEVGYGLLTVSAHSLVWKFYAATVFDPETGVKISDPVLLDSMTINK